jgi:ribosomal protein S18 acetylase RimI-like enzyme
MGKLQDGHGLRGTAGAACAVIHCGATRKGPGGDTPGMQVRSAAERDIPALMPLMRAYCDFYGSNPPDSGLDTMARALIAASDDQGMLLVAEDEAGKVIGFAAVSWKWSSLRGARIAVLEDLFVAPEARGKGAADALITECAARARANGAPVMSWLTAPDNHRAQAVYERVGGTSATFLEYELELR